MAFWNTPDFGIRPRAVRHRSRRFVAHRRPIRRPSPEALEARCLLTTTYSITDIGAFSLAPPQGFPDYWVGINNASPAQVVAGEGPDGKAFIWDSVHGSKDLGTVNKEANSAGIGINDSGTVVGTSWTSTVTYPKKHGGYGSYTKTVENGFLWTAGRGMSNLGSNVNADAINNSGEIMNFFNSLWDGKTWTSLGNLPGGTHSYALGLNNDGQVVGHTMNSDGTFEDGYLWTPSSANGATGSMIDLGSFDTTSPGVSSANAINSQGWVTGWAKNGDLNGGAGHAFVWEPSAPNATTGTMVDLGTLVINPNPYYVQSEGRAINSSGVVVGYSLLATSTGQADAVIWQPGTGGTYTLTDLNSEIPSGTGWTLDDAKAINDNGLIVAFGQQNGGPLHTVLLTPQTTATALAARATPAPAPGPFHPTAEPPSGSVRISSVAPEGSGSGSLSGPIPAADRAAAPSVLQPIVDFALSDLAARPRARTVVNDRIARPMWADPGVS
jgi:uncharacterized membrane protein